MRTYEAIKEELQSAASSNDTAALKTLAEELLVMDTPNTIASANIALGTVAELTGNYASAIVHYHKALGLLEVLDDRSAKARIAGKLANVYLGTGAYPQALELYQRSLSLFEELPDRLYAALILGGIGSVYASTESYENALDHYHRALDILLEIGTPMHIAFVTINIGSVHYQLGDFEQALEYYHRALAVHEAMDDHGQVALVNSNLMRTYLHMNALEEAHRHLVVAEALPLSDPPSKIVVAQCRASFQERNGDLDAAAQTLQDALMVAQQHGLRAFVGASHQRLRDLAQKRNDFAGYIEHNNEYQRITEEVRGKEATQRLTMIEVERKMEAERRERDKERALLYGALPKSVADRMIRGEDVNCDHFDHAAVMFLDIVGFTNHTSNLPPANVVKLLEHVFGTIDGICETHNVIKIKTIGDSYMCFRGDADAITNAQSVANVALDVINRRFSWPNAEPLTLRVGIHIGPATAGVIGTQRLQYDVWGDTVNVASRLESTGEPGRIHVSELFAVGTMPDAVAFACIERGAVDIKGKGSMTTFWLEGA